MLDDKELHQYLQKVSPGDRERFEAIQCLHQKLMYIKKEGSLSAFNVLKKAQKEERAGASDSSSTPLNGFKTFVKWGAYILLLIAGLGLEFADGAASVNSLFQWISHSLIASFGSLAILLPVTLVLNFFSMVIFYGFEGRALYDALHIPFGTSAKSRLMVHIEEVRLLEQIYVLMQHIKVYTFFASHDSELQKITKQLTEYQNITEEFHKLIYNYQKETTVKKIAKIALRVSGGIMAGLSGYFVVTTAIGLVGFSAATIGIGFPIIGFVAVAVAIGLYLLSRTNSFDYIFNPYGKLVDKLSKRVSSMDTAKESYNESFKYINCTDVPCNTNPESGGGVSPSQSIFKKEDELKKLFDGSSSDATKRRLSLQNGLYSPLKKCIPTQSDKSTTDEKPQETKQKRL